MNKVYGNYNIKVGDILIAKDNLIDSFIKGSKFKVYKIEDEYLHIKLLNSEYDYVAYFHIESQNAECCELSIRSIRENKLKNLFNEA